MVQVVIGGPTGLFGAMRDRASGALALVLAGLVFTLVPATALAAEPASPATAQYSSNLQQACPTCVGGGENSGGGVGGGGGTGGGGTGTVSSTGSGTVGPLPFTGLDLAVLGGIAAALLAAGLLLRRRRVEEPIE